MIEDFILHIGWLVAITGLTYFVVSNYNEQKRLDRENIKDLARRGLLRG